MLFRSDRFTNGLLKVNKNGLCGFINTSGNIITECVYSKNSPFKDGLAVASTKGGSADIIDKNGAVFTDFSKIYGYVSAFEDNYALARKSPVKTEYSYDLKV